MRKLKVIIKFITIFTLGYLLSLVMNPIPETISEANLIAFSVDFVNERREEVKEIGERLLDAKAYVKEGKALGIYLGDGVIICGDNEEACIHEVGHRVDESLGSISESTEFRDVLDNFLVACVEAGDEWGEEDWYCNLARFPGLNGNPIDNWGGYGEAYASMYQYKMFLGKPLPEIFKEFFKGE